MDAIELIRNDHRQLERLFTRLERAERGGDAAEATRIARALARELSIHTAIEEQLLYPALRESGEEVQDEVLDALEEHHAVKLALVELEGMDATHPRFAPKLRVLARSVLHHVSEEEAALLPRLRRGLDARQLGELGASLARAKKSAPTRPHPAAPDEPPRNLVAGAVAALYDRGRDALRGGTEMLISVAQRSAGRGAGVARGLAERARRSGEEVVERGAEALSTVRRRGRVAVEGATARSRAAIDGVERRGGAAMGRVRQRAREAARELEERARAATRSHGAGEAHAERGRSRQRRRPARPSRATQQHRTR
jgi:hemerythrin superfamily protein